MTKKFLTIVALSFTLLFSTSFSFLLADGDIHKQSNGYAKYEMWDGSCFTVHYIDVGQADSALIICKGEAMLIDGGNVADAGLVVEYLKKLKISHLKYIIATHAHEDHIGGLAGVLGQTSVEQVFSPVRTFNTKAFNNFLKFLNAQGVDITIPKDSSSLPLGMSMVEVIAPSKKYKNTNNTSILVKIIHLNNSFLFTGDIETDAEQDIINGGHDLHATVLKVAHHGSKTSSSYIFLQSVKPTYAVISVGTGNTYGHPSPSTINRLNDSAIKIYRTDKQGTIVSKSDGYNVSFSFAR